MTIYDSELAEIIKSQTPVRDQRFAVYNRA